jgi:hypothetical protein
MRSLRRRLLAPVHRALLGALVALTVTVVERRLRRALARRGA